MRSVDDRLEADPGGLLTQDRAFDCVHERDTRLRIFPIGANSATDHRENAELDIGDACLERRHRTGVEDDMICLVVLAPSIEGFNSWHRYGLIVLIQALLQPAEPILSTLNPARFEDRAQHHRKTSAPPA